MTTLRAVDAELAERRRRRDDDRANGSSPERSDTPDPPLRPRPSPSTPASREAARVAANTCRRPTGARRDEAWRHHVGPDGIILPGALGGPWWGPA